MYRIRFHGRGGQGMKTSSRMLGTAFFLSGYEVQDAPRYGAERRGAPISAYVRADQAPIAERGVIPVPDLVVVADDTLIGIPAAGITQGLDAHTVLAVNTDTSAEDWRERLRIDSRIVTLPRFSAEDAGERPYVGALCAGAAARLVGVISCEVLEAAVRDELSALNEEVIEANVVRARAAFDALAEAAQTVIERPDAGEVVAAPDWIDLDLENVARAAPAIHAGATSVKVRTGLWRVMRPVIDYDHCNGYAWICGSFCPDSAINVGADGNPVIDYDHCKGCLICVAQCPPHAIHAVSEIHAQQDEVEAPGQKRGRA